MKNKKIIVFSHGFGSRKDDRGIFTSIAEKLPEFTPFMFNYSKFNKNLGILTVTSISNQVHHLKRVIDCAKQLYPSSDLYIIAHSQGCLVPSILCPDNVNKAVFLTPVTQFDDGLIMDYFSQITGASKNRWGNSIFPRRDGTKMIVPRIYWDDMQNLEPQLSYDDFCKKIPTSVIYASNDEVISAVSPEPIKSKYLYKSFTLNGDHAFSDKSDRAKMIKLVCELLNEQ